MPNRRSRQGGFGLVLLASQIMHIGLDRIPPITLITVVINVAIYMRLIPNMPSVHGACTSNYHVLNKKQWLRLCTSSFYHLDDMHLYFNMISFIWKGITLERKMKSKKFLIVIALFSVLTQVVMLILNKLFAEAFLSNHYLNTCAAGFSAVIFSLKVLTTVNSDENVNVMGLPISIPSRYACWAELILIHILVPNASFTGHLSGILVGLLYTHGPLRKLVKVVKYIISGQFLPGTTNQHNYTRHAAATGHRNSDENLAIQQAIQESLRNSNFQDGSRSGGDGTMNQPPSYGWNISDEPTTHHQDRLYPTLPRNDHQPGFGFAPSAPPYNDGYHNEPSGVPPYPTAGNPPYPATGNPPYPATGNPPYPATGNPPYPATGNPPYTGPRNQPDPSFAYPPSSGISHNEQSQSNESPDEIMRNARLRKFEKHVN